MEVQIKLPDGHIYPINDFLSPIIIMVKEDGRNIFNEGYMPLQSLLDDYFQLAKQRNGTSG